MLIVRKQRFRISELDHLVHQSIWSLILREPYHWSKQASHGYCKPDIMHLIGLVASTISYLSRVPIWYQMRLALAKKL